MLQHSILGDNVIADDQVKKHAGGGLLPRHECRYAIKINQRVRLGGEMRSGKKGPRWSNGAAARRDAGARERILVYGAPHSDVLAEACRWGNQI